MLEWILGGGLVAIVAFVLSSTRAQDGKISRLSEEGEAKVLRVYKRLDEVKEYQDKTFTRQDICALTHKQVTETLCRIEAKLDQMIENNK